MGPDQTITTGPTGATSGSHSHTGEEYWISGPRKDGADRLYGEPGPVEIDEDAREEYWTRVRSEPQRAKHSVANR